jgi:hypothetical protein
MAAKGKESVREWVTGDGNATFSGYGFLAGSMNLADTLPNGIIKEDGTWNMPGSRKLITNVERTNFSKNVLSALKWVDILLTQVISGTLIFGALQNGLELARQYFNRLKKTYPAAVVPEVIVGALAIAARGGVFVAQILAGALRLPLAILSGFVGIFVGLYSSLTSKKAEGKPTTPREKIEIFFATIGDAIWPFAPVAGNLIGVTLPVQRVIPALSMSEKIVASVARMTWMNLVSIVSTIIAITLVALLATGTMGVGLAALPVLPQIIGFIGTGLNFAFGWAGLHIATGTAVATMGAPILTGIANWISLGVVSTKVLVSTMLVGALTTLFSNTFNAVKDNALGTKTGLRSTANSKVAGAKEPLLNNGIGNQSYEYRNGSRQSLSQGNNGGYYNIYRTPSNEYQNNNSPSNEPKKNSKNSVNSKNSNQF